MIQTKLIKFTLLCFFLGIYSLSAQQDKTVTGWVSDEKGEPLPGVSIYVKENKNLGTSSKLDGEFSLNIKGKQAELVFSFIGMKTITKKVKAGEHLKVIMKEDAQVLGEVVAMGVRNVKKDHVSGSVSVISADNLKSQGIASLDVMLDGQVSGLNSTNISGAPGTRSKITIRGENNLSANSEPLWILDGLPMITGIPKTDKGVTNYTDFIMQDGIGNIMPEDIESITILKDAAAASIYGARAANGVIVITTKRGTRSKVTVNYQGNMGLDFLPNIDLGLMNTTEKLQYEKAIIQDFGLEYSYQAGRGGNLYRKRLTGYLSEQEYQNELQRLSNINTNWFKEIFRTGASYSHNINLQGGTDKISYYTSFGLRSQEGTLKFNQYNSANVLAKLDYRPLATDKLIFNVDVSLDTRENSDNASVQDPFVYAVFANPYERPYDENGEYSSDLSFVGNNYSPRLASGYVYDSFNMIKELEKNRKKQQGIDGSLTLRLQYKPLKGLILSSSFRKALGFQTTTTEIDNGTYTSWVREHFARRALGIAEGGIIPDRYDNGELSEDAGKSDSWVVNNKIQYSFDIKQRHFFSTMAFMEVMSRKYNNFGYTSPIYYSDYRITGIPTFDYEGLTYEQMLPSLNTQSGDPKSNLFRTYIGQDRSVSFAGLLSYSYDNRYVLDFSYRADGADVIGNVQRFTPLWSLGARYNIHNEKFFNSDFFNEVVLRGTYGFTGNIDRSAYPFSVIELGANYYQGNRYVKRYQYPNPTVKWERKKDMGIGADISMFNRRINISADYYVNRTEDVLTDLPIPVSTGRKSVRANGGILENSGYEIQLNTRWINQEDLTFSTAFVFGHNKNKIVKSQFALKSWKESERGKVRQGGIISIEGNETGSVYGWIDAGVNPKTGNPRFYLTEEGKLDYATFLDEWETYSDETKEKLLASMPSLNEIPEVVDMMLYEKGGRTLPYMLSSMQYLGTTNPKIVGGFNTYFRYKNITFTTNWTFKAGHIIPVFNDYLNAPNVTLLDQLSIGGDIGYRNDLSISSTNREKKYLNYWKVPGDNGTRRFVTEHNRDLWATMHTSSRYAKGDYLRMSNVSISYRFDKSVADKLLARNFTVGLNIRNLLTFTRYKGLDVTTNGAFSYPTSRQVNFNISLGF